MKPASLTLIVVTEGPASLAAPALAERYPDARAETGSVLVPVPTHQTAEAVLAYCRKRRIGVVGSCLVARRVVRP